MISYELLLLLMCMMCSFQNISCCEVCLPTSDLPHKAKLTCVIPADSGDNVHQSKDVLASVVNISPEGTIRFWPNISSPGIFIESTVGCRGKEFHTLTSLPVRVKLFINGVLSIPGV